MPGNNQDLTRHTPPATPANVPDFRLDYPYPVQIDAETVPASRFRLQKFLTALMKHWWVPVVTLVLGVMAAGAYVYWKTPTYVSWARMWETVKLRLPEGSLFAEDVQNFLGTQTELLQSDTLRDLALARLRASTNTVPVPRGDDGEPLPVKIRVASAAKSSVFTLEATSANAAYSQSYLDALMTVYLEYKRNIRKVVSGDTLASITEQVQRAERDLKTEQDILTAFQRTNNLAILQEEGTIAGGYLARLKTQLSDLQLEARLLGAAAADEERNAATNLATFDFTGLSTLTSQSTAGAPTEHLTAFKELELVKIQREKLSKNLRPRHPKIVKLDADIERGEKLLDIYRRQSRQQLAASRANVQLKLENVQTAIREWEGKVVESNTRIAEAERLKVNVQRSQSVYERLVLLVQNVGISRNIDQETLAVLEPASLARRSYAQEKSLVGFSVFGGLGIGLGIIFLITMRDDRLNSLVEVNEKLGENVVGQVPEIENLGKGSSAPPLQITDEHHGYAESFRSLRSALLFMATGTANERPKVILITSALPNEGKSTVAANLARTLAKGGSRVVLVDGDLRKGVLHQMFGLKREPGLSETLRQPERLEEFLQKDTELNFAFLSSGTVANNSGDLFLGATFDQVLARLREQFDYVVIDSSPVFAADDAATLAPKVDGTLFVVRSRFSGARMVREALELLYMRQARILGLVFNRADASARSYHYYKYAQYYPAQVTTDH